MLKVFVRQIKANRVSTCRRNYVPEDHLSPPVRQVGGGYDYSDGRDRTVLSPRCTDPRHGAEQVNCSVGTFAWFLPRTPQ